MRVRDAMTLGVLGLALAPAPAGAESEPERFSIRPELKATYEANDNGSLAPNGQGRDWTHGIWLEPKLSVDLHRPRWRVGGSLGADIRHSFDDSRLRDEFLDVNAYGEVEPLRGLLLRVSDSFVPQAIRLGSPADDTGNLSQSNLLRVEARYRHERERGPALEFGIGGERFDTEGFPAQIDLDGDGIAEQVDDLHSDYWQASSFLEARHALGRHSQVYLRGEMRDRRFDEIPRADLTEWSGLVGLRSHLARRLDVDVAFGYGRVRYDDLGSDSRLLGRADIDYAMPRGWELKGTFVQRFSSDAGGNDFDETSGRLGLSKTLGTRTRASLGLLWTRFRSDTPSADYDVVTALEFSLARQLTRRIDAVLGYRHWRNGGNNQTNDFHQNRVTLGLTYRH